MMKNKTNFLLVLGIVLIFSVMYSHIATAEQVTTKTKTKAKATEKIKAKPKTAEKTKNITPITNQTKNTSTSNYDAELAKCDKLSGADKYLCKKDLELSKKIQDDKTKAIPYVIGPVTFYYVNNHIEKTSQGGTLLTIYFVVENTGSSKDVTLSCSRQNSCNYVLSDGKKEIQYTTNTLVYGTLTLKPHVPKLLEWSFFQGLNYDPAKDYSLKIKEPWGSGTIPLGID
jgi:hypothetical protein